MFLVAEADAKVVATARAEVENFWSEGGVMHFGERRRIVYELRVMWPIDNTGGEVPPLTWSYGGDTYDFETGDPGQGYEDLSSVYTAIYKLPTAWVVS
jgi:hypothetical protein